MKILDSTVLIAILKEIKCISLIDSILKLNHQLVITQSVYAELLDGYTEVECKKLMKIKKIQLINLNSPKEIEQLKKTYPGLGDGEIDSLLSYQKLVKQEKSIYCILDDATARKKAKKLGINYTGFLGLLKLLKKRKILSDKDYSDIIKKLRNSNFRLPKDIC